MTCSGDFNGHLLDGVQKLHFIGIGGSGMYPLVQILTSKGYTITGSDVSESSITASERALGVTVYIGHDPAQIEGADMVVYSAAIHEDNPELSAARAHGLPMTNYGMCISLAQGVLERVLSPFPEALAAWRAEAQLPG